MPDEAPLEWPMEEEDELFLMANLHPRDTGLPLTVWVSPRAGARHDARVKVVTSPGRTRPSEMAVVTIRPEPRLLHGEVGAADLGKITEWIRLNHELLIDYWNERATTFEFVRRHQRLPD